jgi:hypothetical protein
MPEITIDLDEQNELLDRTLPWELSLKVGGTRYVTRRPTVAEVGQLARVEQMNEPQAYELLASLFDDPKPDVRSWSLESIQAAVAAYAAYLRTRVEKKAQAIASVVRAQVAATTTPRT